MKDLTHQSASMKAPTTEHTRDLQQLCLSTDQLEASKGILCQNLGRIAIAIVSCPVEVDKALSRCAQDFQASQKQKYDACENIPRDPQPRRTSSIEQETSQTFLRS